MTAPFFKGRLFGPGLPGAGLTASGRWHDDKLVLNTESISLLVPAGDLRLEQAGFNLRQVRVSWRSAQGDFALFIGEAEDADRFLFQAPQSIAMHAGIAARRRHRVESRFRAALLVYGLVLCLPLFLLALFLMNTDRLAGWVAQAVPPEQEARIGSLVLAQTRAHTRLVQQGPAHAAITDIGTKLTAGSRYAYQWFVAENNEVNAFAAPGGVIVVYTGLIAQTSRADELAGVIAHEIAHVEQRHSLKNMIKSASLGVLLSIAVGDWSGSAIGGWIANLTQLKFSRDAEMEADREGARRMAGAGIAPDHMVDFFARLAKNEHSIAVPLSILATHPASEERMAALRQVISILPQRRYQPLNIDWETVRSSIKTSMAVPKATFIGALA